MYKVVVRLMDDSGRMLGWAEDHAHARGDGKLWIEHPVAVPVIEDGLFTKISAHWADVNIEVRMPIVAPLPIVKGQIVPIEAPWPVFDLGRPAGGLPPVVITRNVAITVPTGTLNPVGVRMG